MKKELLDEETENVNGGEWDSGRYEDLEHNYYVISNDCTFDKNNKIYLRSDALKKADEIGGFVTGGEFINVYAFDWRNLYVRHCIYASTKFMQTHPEYKPGFRR